MSDLITQRKQKSYKGAYNYFRDGKIYCEENFEVFKDHKEFTTEFVSTLYGRVATGELLKISVNYKVDKKLNPVHVSISKSLGLEFSQEIYDHNPRSNNLIYKFTNSKGNVTEYKMTTPPKFHITTPTSATSCLFLLSKKFENAAKNYYTIISNNNKWRYGDDLHSKSLVVERINDPEQEALAINGKKLNAELYKICDDSGARDEMATLAGPSVRAYVSHHLAIPYVLIEEKSNLKIQIKFFNNLEGS